MTEGTLLPHASPASPETSSRTFGEELIEAMQQAVEVMEGRLAPSRSWTPPESPAVS